VQNKTGSELLWGPNGRELFFLAPNGAVMSVRVEGGATWSAGTPTTVIDGRYYRGPDTNIARTYDVSRDGKRFLMIKDVRDPKETSAPVRIVVVQNWLEELKRLVPTIR
jgi:hypothetical protein